jgi:hypothetical protein
MQRRPNSHAAHDRDEGTAVKVSADQLDSLTAIGDVLVLASASSPAERELLDSWLRRQRREHPDFPVDLLELPAQDGPPAAVVAQLVEKLEKDEDRSVVPVRVFWVPGGLSMRSSVVALLASHGTYRPPELLGDREAVSLFTDEVVDRHPHVIEDQLAVAAVELLVVAEDTQVACDGQSGGVARDRDHALLAVWISFGIAAPHDDEYLAARAQRPGDEPLAPVDDVAVAVADDAGRDVARIR